MGGWWGTFNEYPVVDSFPGSRPNGHCREVPVRSADVPGLLPGDVVHPNPSVIVDDHIGHTTLVGNDFTGAGER